jgi:hypothetical protein
MAVHIVGGFNFFRNWQPVFKSGYTVYSLPAVYKSYTEFMHTLATHGITSPFHFVSECVMVSHCSGF